MKTIQTFIVHGKGATRTVEHGKGNVPDLLVAEKGIILPPRYDKGDIVLMRRHERIRGKLFVQCAIPDHMV